MKILYFGTVCDLAEYEKILYKCKQKPTVATINFELALLEGFKKNKIDVDVFSYPMIPTFPKSRLLLWANKTQMLDCGYKCVWLKTINIPFLKQVSRARDGKKSIKKWLQKNGTENCAILVYSVPPFLVKDIITYSKKYKINCYCIVPDLVKNMYINSKSGIVTNYIKKQYLKGALKYQGMFDGYIYLTQAMKDEINPLKPYVVMEGIANNDIFNQIADIDKSEKFIIMYAGRLHRKYGIFNLIDAFEMINKELELWIFGDGSAATEVEQRAAINPRIRFMGRRPLSEILKYEKMATLLVNPRNPEEEFTKYSFPSKTIEYMLSGTPLLTTRLSGIPEEYFKFVFSVEKNDAYSMKSKIEEILRLDRQQLDKIGNAAMKFVSENKNSEVQVKRILNFIKMVEEHKLDDL